MRRRLVNAKPFKSRQISIPLDENEEAEVLRAAEREHMTKTAWSRRALLRAASETPGTAG